MSTQHSRGESSSDWRVIHVEGRYYCPEKNCHVKPEGWFRETAAKVHVRTVHFGQTEILWWCPYCDFDSRTRRDVSVHCERHHVKVRDEQYHCQRCANAWCFMIADLNNHETRDCPGRDSRLHPERRLAGRVWTKDEKPIVAASLASPSDVRRLMSTCWLISSRRLFQTALAKLCLVDRLQTDLDHGDGPSAGALVPQGHPLPSRPLEADNVDSSRERRLSRPFRHVHESNPAKRHQPSSRHPSEADFVGRNSAADTVERDSPVEESREADTQASGLPFASSTHGISRRSAGDARGKQPANTKENYHCPVETCNHKPKGWVSETVLKIHVRTQHFGEDRKQISWWCNYCDYHDKMTRYVEDHQKRHLKTSRPRLTCTSCDNVFYANPITELLKDHQLRDCPARGPNQHPERQLAGRVWKTDEKPIVVASLTRHAEWCSVDPLPIDPHRGEGPSANVFVPQRRSSFDYSREVDMNSPAASDKTSSTPCPRTDVRHLAGRPRLSSSVASGADSSAADAHEVDPKEWLDSRQEAFKKARNPEEFLNRLKTRIPDDILGQ